jgi:two-component system, chemotaxis family, response regulator Rcp1
VIFSNSSPGTRGPTIVMAASTTLDESMTHTPDTEQVSAPGWRRDARQKGVILLIEDDHGDQLLTCEALSESALAHQIVVVSDGEEALEYLNQTGRYSDGARAPRPDLILLDLNMPKINGRQLASKLKSDPRLQTIPIVVLSTSDYHDDVAHCYRTGVNSYVHKPTNYDDFVATINAVEHYWLRVVQPPPRP